MRKHFIFSVSVALSMILMVNPLLIGSSRKMPAAAPTTKRIEPPRRVNKPIRPTRPFADEGQSTTLLPNGSWLLIGGQGANGPKNTVVVRNPFTGQTQELPAKLQTARAWHSATMLPNGRILVFGGIGPNGNVVNHAEIFNGYTLAFELTTPARLPAARAFHTATLLIDGSVLIAGGESNGQLRAAAELWNPKTGVNQVVTNGLNVARRKHQATLLPDGNVLLQGGVDDAGNELLAAAEVFNRETLSLQWGGGFTEQPDGRPSFLSLSSPTEGATDVPVETAISLLFSKALRADTVNSESFALIGPTSQVAVNVVPAESGRLVFITPREPLEPQTTYNAFVSGSVDTSNALVTSTAISFTTSGSSDENKENNRDEPDSPSDSESWTPNARNLMGNWRSDYSDSHWQKLPPLSAPSGVTAVAGQVLTLDGKPLASVTLSISGTTTQTDNTGRFLLQSIKPGRQVVIIDGRTANTRARTYGIFRVGVDVIGGETNVLGFTIWMPRLDVEHAVDIQAPTNSEVTITNPGIPGLELRLPANTLIRDLDGRTVTNISITPIPVDRPPFPLPPGVNVPVFFTIQPGGAQVIPPRARVIYPNYSNEKPGSRIDFWNYDPTEKGWYIYGQGTVTPDGKQVVPDPGVVIYEFSGVMINTGATPPTDAPVACNPCEDADPVDLSTGLFVYKKTDLFLPDVIPIVLERTYRNQDLAIRPFGIGGTHQYQMFMYSARQYREADLILPDGGRVHFERTSPGESFGDAEFLCTTNFGPFYMAELWWNGTNPVDVWYMRLRDGTTYVFGENAPLQAIIDRNGNRLNISRATVNQFGSPSGNVTKVTSPNGKYIEFTYVPNSNRVSKATDNMGREVNYTYDANGRLSTVTDANNGITEYTYDLSHRMTSIKDARGIVYLTNEYDTNGRVRKQTLVDDTPATSSDNPTYRFTYVTNSGGKVLQTDVTDPRGNVRRVTFNDKGFWLTDTFAVGTPEEQTSVVERQPTTNLTLNGIDALGRRTALTYDPLGGITSVTKLALTAEASTTRYTYYGVNPASVTDPLGRTTHFAYDGNAKLAAVVDPLGRQTTFENNDQGQPILVTYPLGNTVSFKYQSGLLVSASDQNGREVSRTVDDAGRTMAITDSLGRTTLLEHDALNQLKKLTDAQGAVTEFTYDPNGNLLLLKDPRQKITTYTYDNMDRAITRTDPLQGANSVERYEYDLNGNLKKVTDRRGKVTVFDYDYLDRLNFTGFGEVSPGVYESTISYSYDLADRLRTAAGSTSGTITLDYDDFDSLLSEVTSQGSVAYTYDTVGRQKTMMVAGQPTVSYDYDDVNRLKQVSQGTASVKFTYDDGDRLTSKMLPNGVVAEYSYDSGSQLSGIVHRLGNSVLGNLTYEYDQLGRRSRVGGTYARVTLPQELTVTAHNDANQLTQRGTSNLTYDANGNLTGDGVYTYTWNARNELASIAGSGLNATFTYDAFGRRSAKTINGQTTEFLYDGADAVQEKVSGTPSANMLMGGLDQPFGRTDATGTVNFLTDALGSTLALTDQSGSEVTQYTYEPFGQTSLTGSASANASQYTGRENDGTGLYYYRARYYSPTLQRFISEDPIEFAGGDVNLYAYVMNDPINNVDPLGLQRKEYPKQGNLPGTNVPYRMDTKQEPRPNMHVDWPDGGQSVITPEGGWQTTHGGKPCAKPPKKYRKALRPVVASFMRRARRVGRFIPGATAILTLASIDAAAQDLSGRKNKTIFDYVEVGVDHFSPITADDVGYVINNFWRETPWDPFGDLWRDFKRYVGSEP